MASSSSSHPWKHDVFLSFRGKDTRTNFTGHLYHALIDKGIRTFIDRKIERGEEITPALVDAIKGSRISIVVFSQDYASSPCCLDELVMMVFGCNELKGHLVLPIFYKVDPDDVKKQSGRFGEAWKKLVAEFVGSSEKVNKWREALVKASNLAGWPLELQDEAEVIQKIVEEVSSKLNRKLLPVAEHTVGLESHVQEVTRMLSVGVKDFLMVGICGTGGIGKTTLAKATYNRITDQFEDSCFLENVRKTSDQSGFGQLLGRLCRKRVLIVIDDVDDVDQLKQLEELNCFGEGSRLIITTRDERLLVERDVVRVHKLYALSSDNALLLFSWNAFKQSQPPEEYVKLAQWIVNYAGGLPLALVVLGSFLYKRDVPEWESEIAKLNKNPNKKISEILRISYENLDDNEKAIFLDIACFFKGMDKDAVMKILDACGFNPLIGVKVLIEKSLITIENNKLHMHALLQSMGRDVVRQQSYNPNRRSRLWFHEEVLGVLTGNMGTDDIEGILLDLPEPKEIKLDAEAFMKMNSLRILLIRNACITGDLVDLPKEVRWIEWPECPLPTMPSGFHARKLVGLNMHRGCISKFGEGFKTYSYLKFLDLRDCESLVETPDFTFIPDLERLNLGGCSKLVEVHESVGNLDKLEFLSFEFCCNLRSLPRRFKLRNLRTLLLTSCTKLEAFPEIEEKMKWLEKVCLSWTAIKELPSSIENLTGLKVLKLTHCKSLTKLPSSIYRLEHLKLLFLEGCSKLEEFPMAVSCHSSSEFTMLRWLDLNNCHLLRSDFLREHNCFSALKDLILSGNDFDILPPSICHLHNLRTLRLSKCKNIREIPELPLNIKRLEARDCESLERFAQLARIFKSNKEEKPNRLHDVDFSNCHRLAKNEGKFLDSALRSKKYRQDLRIEIFLPGSEIPDCFSCPSEGNSFSLQVPSNNFEKIRGLVLCAILSLKDGETANISREVFINGQNITMFSRQFFSLQSDHVWLYYIPRRCFPSKQEGTVARFDVSYKFLGASMGCNLKRCGAYLVCKGDEVIGDLSISRSISFQKESLSLDLKRSCHENEMEHNFGSKNKKNKETTISLMPFTTDEIEHQRNNNPKCSKNVDDQVKRNINQLGSTSQLQQLNSESSQFSFWKGTEKHIMAFNAENNKSELPP